MKDTRSIYQRLSGAGAVLDHHESDLYVRVDPAAAAIVAEWIKEAPSGRGCRSFRSQLDDREWIEIPFHYDPFWQRRGPR